MKKNLLKILCVALCASLLCVGLTACGGEKWKGTSMTNPGETDKAEYVKGGFIYETENYLYFINGVATSSDNNKFGKPVKGALMAVSKTDLSGIAEVVVPKLFATTNYQQGLFVKDGYVYYGTPNTEKNSDNQVAYSEMTFMRTKLDGTGSEAFFTVTSHSAEYRFIAKENAVYIVYYDNVDTSLKSYNTATKEEKVIAKTDAKVQVATENITDNEHGESLNAYKFVGDTLVYTVTVYNEKYSEDKLADTEATRATASYNKVYAYNVGDEKAQVKLGGKADGATYDLKLVKGATLYYGKTKNAIASTFATDATMQTVKEVKTDYIVDANLFVGDEVYTLSEGKVYKDSIIKGQLNDDKELVLISDKVSTMLFVENNELYYYNATNQLAKTELGKDDAHEVVISENSANTTWYKPVMMTIGQNKYIFFADSSSYGLNYVRYVLLDDSKIVEEDTDDDDKIDKWYYEATQSKLLCKMSEEEKAKMVTSKINDISTKLDSGDIVLDVDDNGEYIKTTDGKYTFAPVTEARAMYEALSATAKSAVEESALNTLKNYEKAIEKYALYIKLEGIDEYALSAEKDEAEKTRLQTAYNEVKEEINKFMDSDEFNTVSGYIKDQYKWYFQKATALFEEK